MDIYRQSESSEGKTLDGTKIRDILSEKHALPSLPFQRFSHWFNFDFGSYLFSQVLQLGDVVNKMNAHQVAACMEWKEFSILDHQSIHLTDL